MASRTISFEYEDILVREIATELNMDMIDIKQLERDLVEHYKGFLSDDIKMVLEDWRDE